MQLPFIERHTEKLKEYKMQQIAYLDNEARDRLQEYDPFAENAKYDRIIIMKGSLGNARNDPERTLPGYCRRKLALHNDGIGK